MIASRSASLVRRWVEVYTHGLPVDVGGRRRDEIDADLWSQLEDAWLTGRGDRSAGAEILMRLLAGVPADVAWRLAHRNGDRAPSAVGGVSTPGTRGVGQVAVVAGIGGLTAVGLLLGDSLMRPERSRDALWADPVLGIVLVLALVAAILGTAMATAGLVFVFQERIGGLAAVAGSIGSLGGLVGWAGGLMLLLLPLGSAVVICSLALARVIDRRLALAYVASAVAFGVVIVQAPVTTEEIAAVIVLMAPYAIAWVAIGASIIRGVPRPEPASGA
jgi:hypothetical protein